MKGFYRGWLQVIVAFLVQGISGASIFISYSLVVAPLKLEFQPSNAVLMLGITMVSLVSGVISPVLGKAIDQKSIRSLMLVGAISLSLGFLSLSFVTAMTQVVIIYAVFMAASGALLGPLASAALLARWFNRRRGLAMGLASSGTAMGGLLLPPLIQGLIDVFEWRMALQIFSLVVFITSVPLIALLVKDQPEEQDLEIESPLDTESAEHRPGALQPLTSKQILGDIRFWILTFAVGSLFAGGVGVTSNMVQLSATKGVDVTQTALLLSVVAGANFTAKLLWSSIIDRWKPVIALGVMVVVQLIAMTGFIIAQDFTGLVISILFYGLSSGGVSVAWSLTLSRIYGAVRLGQVMGFMTFTLMPFTMLAPPLIGWSYDVTQSFNYGLIGYSIMLGVVLVCLPKLRTTSGRSATAEA